VKLGHDPIDVVHDERLDAATAGLDAQAMPCSVERLAMPLAAGRDITAPLLPDPD
jgi:hypothetical protein